MLHLRGDTASTAPSADSFREVEVVAGLAGGAHIHGWARLPGSWRLIDLLNNVREPMLTLGTAPHGAASASITLTRSQVAWMAPLQSDRVAEADDAADGRSLQSEHPVVAHVASFVLCGTIATHPGVEWVNFLVGRAGPPAEFFGLSDACLADGTPLPASSLVVNAALVAALASTH